jgi:SET domain-containing protein
MSLCPKIEHELINVQISNVHGFGLFASKDIKKNTRICDYLGEKLTWKQYRSRYPVPLERNYYRGRNLWIIVSDKEPYLSKNPVNYINEGEPNVFLKAKGLYALRDICASEELFLTYPKSYKRTWLIKN